MQTIGLLGGMSWESSAVYHELLNTGVRDRLGGLHSARTVMTSVDLAELAALAEAGRWDDVAAVLVADAQGVERAGADFLLMCTTTYHRVAEQVASSVDIPLVHLADVVADAIDAAGLTSVGFLGTKFSMRDPFFTDRLASHGLEVHVPGAEHHDRLDRMIYDELVHGRLLDSSRREVVALVDELWDAGAAGVVLGCTELELLVKQADADVPVFPCTTLHVAAALDRALA